MTDPTPAFSTPPEAVPYVTPAMPARRPWNVLAIVSLATALLALGLVAVIAGHAALAQLRRSDEAGRPLAIAGLVLGYLGIAITLGLVAFWVFTLSTGSLVIAPVVGGA